ncbi:MAG: hypothetical protein IJL07_09070 [Lachnospiraceae bacterium]|nr:hypothetical protein [Lachnospiraceae bacterium]
MERVYYSIDEERARSAHEMMSFRDYKPGSKTEEYQSYVNKAYDIADAIAEERQADAEKAYGLAERYAKRLADNMNAESRIGCMCPSVMISGPSNFPVRRKEKQNAAWDRNHKEWNEIQEILHRIEDIRYGREIIKSSDEDAVEKLEKKLEELKAMQEKMKAANKAVRAKDEEQGNAKLRELGFTDEQISELRKPDFCGRIGFPDYALQNNNANIHRVEDRIKSLKATKEKGTQEEEYGSFKVVENTEIMRIQIFFDGKPEPEVRDLLKTNGFKWAPSQGAWQRQLTGNARYAMKQLTEQLKDMLEGETA